MKDYQPTKNNPYHLDHDVYMATLWHIRGYERRQMEADAILQECVPPPDGMPRSGGIGDPTCSIATKREALLARNRVIDRALDTIPGPYREAVFRNILYHEKYPTIDGLIPLHARSTYSRYKARAIYDIAMGLGLM